MDKKLQDVLENRADVSGADKNFCDSCGENLVFSMKDNYHEFTVGLTTILNCLKIAENKGYVPKLPIEWWFMLNESSDMNK